jgi:hypothetical protein
MNSGPALGHSAGQDPRPTDPEPRKMQTTPLQNTTLLQRTGGRMPDRGRASGPSEATEDDEAPGAPDATMYESLDTFRV